MGSIVTAPGRAVPQGVEKRLLIDGQQRLTTLFEPVCSHVSLALIEQPQEEAVDEGIEKVRELKQREATWHAVVVEFAAREGLPDILGADGRDPMDSVAESRHQPTASLIVAPPVERNRSSIGDVSKRWYLMAG